MDGNQPIAASDTHTDFATFFNNAVPQLRRLAYARTGNWATADDLVQDAMADAHRRWNHITTLDNPHAWARRAILNRSATTWRSRKREHNALTKIANDPLTDRVEDEPTLHDHELWTAIRQLPRRQQDVVLLRWFEDLTTNEVAHTLGCSPETVRTHWKRARTHLAATLGVTDSDENGNDTPLTTQEPQP